MSIEQKTIMRHAANHGLRSSALPDGAVLIESRASFKGETFTVTTSIMTVRGLYRLLGY